MVVMLLRPCHLVTVSPCFCRIGCRQEHALVKSRGSWQSPPPPLLLQMQLTKELVPFMHLLPGIVHGDDQDMNSILHKTCNCQWNLAYTEQYKAKVRSRTKIGAQKKSRSKRPDCKTRHHKHTFCFVVNERASRQARSGIVNRKSRLSLLAFAAVSSPVASKLSNKHSGAHCLRAEGVWSQSDCGTQ